MEERKQEELELYLHIPFCVRKCAYCDFLSFRIPEETQVERYLKALTGQMSRWSRELGGRPVKSVFFGGGTPTILNPLQIDRLMTALRGFFTIRPDAEITMECNPGTADEKKLSVMRETGINRLSIGLQSIHEQELHTLGRIHTYGEFLECFRAARKTGFANLNVDLMSGIPGQTSQRWEETLRAVTELAPEHISAYSLLIEEGTPFYDRYHADEVRRDTGGIPCLLPTEEEERQMYVRTKELLGRAGYHRYEISNYARPGYECVHNTGYWTGTEYLGLGLGASSCLRRRPENKEDAGSRSMVRFRTQSNFEAYQNGDDHMQEQSVLSAEMQMEETMFLGLRRMAGVSERSFYERFGITIRQQYPGILERLKREGLLYERFEGEDVRVCLTDRGIDVSNRVMAAFL